MRHKTILIAASALVGVAVIGAVYLYRLDIAVTLATTLTDEAAFRTNFMRGEIKSIADACSRNPALSGGNCQIFAECMAGSIDKSLSYEQLKTFGSNPARLVHEPPYSDILMAAQAKCKAA